MISDKQVGLAALLLAVIIPVQAAERPIRALQLTVYNLSVENSKRIIDKAAAEKFNTIILNIPVRNGIKLNSMPWIIPNQLTWSRENLLDVVMYARQKKIEVVPLLPLLSHQHILLAPKFQSLMYNSRTYDPRKRKVYEIVLPIINELVDLLHPKAIHIGHDEVVGWKEKHYEKGLLRRSEHILPPDLFLYDVNRIHAYLRKKHIETWMWGDMLISPSEFTAMHDRGDVNGISEGYGKALRLKISRDIVICDWHYFNEKSEFPSLSTFRNEGFRVLGTSWKKTKTIRNFSRYAAMHGAEGMIATTWFYALQKDLNVVERIIVESGKEFSKYFPDEK